jgi:hypothetical protein
MSDARYYTVLGSLPHLPRFDRARRLPISREHLDQRLSMLSAVDARVVRQAEEFLGWHAEPALGDAAILAAFDTWLQHVRQPALRRFAEFRMLLRTVVAAFRWRRLGQGLPAGRWGIEPWATHIRRNFEHANFALIPRLPWVAPIADGIERRASLELQQHLLHTVWGALETLPGPQSFTLDAIIVYMFKWDVLDRWLRYDAAATRHQLLALVRQAGIEVSADARQRF